MSWLLPMLNAAAVEWFSYASHVAWQASFVAVVLLAVVWLGGRWPSPLRYWLLVLALAKFALPPLLPLPTGLFSQVGPVIRAESNEATPVAAAAPIGAPADFPAPLGMMPVEQKPSDSFSLPMHSTVAPHTAAPALDGKVWWMLLHLIGFVAVSVWIVTGLFAMRRALRHAEEISEGELWRRFTRLAAQLGLRRPPRLLVSQDPCGPAAFGVLRPVVLLPSAVLSLEAPALDAILAHELAHHRRSDPLVNWLQLALTAVWWFNPILWFLNRQVRKVREDCWDDLLLTRNLTSEEAYCDTLLRAASRLTGPPPASVSLGFSDRLHPLGRRFERILDRTLRRASRLSLAGFLFLALLAIIFLPGLRRSVGETPESKAKRVEQQAQADRGAQKKVAEPAQQADPSVASKAKTPPPEATSLWPEGATVVGRVIDHRGTPVANAEVLLLGKERVIVDAERRNWFVPEQGGVKPPSTRTDKSGAFTITRKQGTADRLAVIAEDPLFWAVSRESLTDFDTVEIKLPESGTLAVRCDMPGKPSKLPVLIESKALRGADWNADSLWFHMSTFKLNNPGETLFERLPPGEYAVQRYHESKTGASWLETGADRELVTIDSAKQSAISFERKIGKPLSGLVRGMENVDLRLALLTISHVGPEEIRERNGKPVRIYVAFDVVSIDAEGRFTTDPIPPGKYSASLFALRASTPELSTQSADFSGGVSFTVPEEGDPPLVELVAKANRPPDLSQVTDWRVRVVDEEGAPVSKAQAMYHTADAGHGLWVQGSDGIIFLGGSGPFRTEAMDVLVRCDGYASAIARFAGKERDKLSKGEATITLSRGNKVELRFNLPKNMTWPKGALPEAYFDDLQDRVRMMWQPGNRRPDAVWDFNALNLREVGTGRFEFRLAEEAPPFHLAVHIPGFLQCFEAGPFTPADVKNGVLEIDLPRPATLDLSFDPGDQSGADSPFANASLYVSRQLSRESYLNISSAMDASLNPTLKLTDLAPGPYMVSAQTQPKADHQPLPGTEINVGRYFDQKTLNLREGQIERIAFRATPFDPNAFRGTRTAVVRIRTTDGQPAKGRKASVQYPDLNYGAHVVFAGNVPESGEIVLAGITDKPLPSWYPFPSYSVHVDDKWVGSFNFSDGPPTEQFDIVLPPVIGDMAPDVELTNLETEKSLRLSSLRGKVVFLEFWATWCGPCQEPMSKLNALGDEQRTAWKDRVSLIPISIDADPVRVRSHVRQRGWTALEQYRSSGTGGADFQARAAKAFGVGSVPEAILIGPDGKILWRGHPLEPFGGKEAKARIEELLK